MIDDPGSLSLAEGWGDPEGEGSREKGLWFHVRGSEKLVCAVLSEVPVTFRGHWVERHFYLCRASCPCGGREDKSDPRWAFSVLELGGRRVGQVEVGWQTARDLLNLANRAGGLRGLVVRFWKENGHRFGRLCVAPADAVMNPNELPEASDVEGSILGSFGREQVPIALQGAFRR